MRVSIDKIDVGYELTPLSKVMGEEGMNAGSLGIISYENPIHFDPEYSRKAGLKAPIATGMTTTFYLNQLAMDFFGEAWVTGTSAMQYKYISPVYLGDTLICRGKVIEKAKVDSGYRLTLELWAERPDGQRTTVGGCSVTVAS